jgi:putative acetyltransferase
MELSGIEKKEPGRMKPEITIRSETDADIGTIADVTIAAFKTLEISNHTEQFIVEALRVAKALTISLVAEVNGRAAGHVHSLP